MTTLIDEDYSALGENYLAGLGVNLIDSQDAGQLNIGTYRTNRNIQIGNSTNTGTINLHSGAGGITVSASGAMDLRGAATGTGSVHLGTQGSGDVHLLAAVGDVTIDAGAGSTLKLGTGTTGSIEIGKTGSTLTTKGSLEVEDGVMYLGSATANNVRFRWDEASDKLHLERRDGTTWKSASFWHIPLPMT